MTANNSWRQFLQPIDACELEEIRRGTIFEIGAVVFVMGWAGPISIDPSGSTENSPNRRIWETRSTRFIKSWIRTFPLTKVFLSSPAIVQVVLGDSIYPSVRMQMGLGHPPGTWVRESTHLQTSTVPG